MSNIMYTLLYMQVDIQLSIWGAGKNVFHLHPFWTLINALCIARLSVVERFSFSTRKAFSYRHELPVLSLELRNDKKCKYFMFLENELTTVRANNDLNYHLNLFFKKMIDESSYVKIECCTLKFKPFILACCNCLICAKFFSFAVKRVNSILTPHPSRYDDKRIIFNV